MFDFTSYLTFINANHANINIGINIFTTILLIVLIIIGSSTIGNIALSILMITQLVHLTIMVALKYQYSMGSDQADPVVSLDASEF